MERDGRGAIDKYEYFIFLLSTSAVLFLFLLEDCLDALKAEIGAG